MPVLMPAAVTPMTPEGKVDDVSLLRLLAWYEAAGCDGIVVAGTNGEGPSLAPFEKRDLVRRVNDWAQSPFRVILGVATPSLEEAKWMARQSLGGILLMAPSYFREAQWPEIEAWFEAVLSSSPAPVWLYNFPQRTGVRFPAEGLARLARFEQLAGLKDSSGEVENLVAFRQALPGRELLLGAEPLWPQADGWDGLISGAANSIAPWLRVALDDPMKWPLIAPILELIRSRPQPAFHKALLAHHGVLASSAVRLPLRTVTDDEGYIEAIGSFFGRVP